MEKKIISNEHRIHWDKTEYYLLEHVRIVQHVARLKGFDITLAQASEVWEEYSDSVFASFMDVGSEYFRNGVEGIWNCIKAYFPEVDEEQLVVLDDHLQSSELIVDFAVTQKSRR